MTTNPPGFVALDHRRERAVAVADVFEHPTRVREIESVGRQRVAGDVVHAELEVVFVALVEPIVEIGRQHVPVGRDQRRERTRNRTAAGTDLQTVPARLRAEATEPADRRLVEQGAELLEALALQLGRLVRRAVAAAHVLVVSRAYRASRRSPSAMDPPGFGRVGGRGCAQVR